MAPCGPGQQARAVPPTPTERSSPTFVRRPRGTDRTPHSCWCERLAVGVPSCGLTSKTPVPESPGPCAVSFLRMLPPWHNRQPWGPTSDWADRTVWALTRRLHGRPGKAPGATPKGHSCSWHTHLSQRLPVAPPASPRPPPLPPLTPHTSALLQNASLPPAVGGFPATPGGVSRRSLLGTRGHQRLSWGQWEGV